MSQLFHLLENHFFLNLSVQFGLSREDTTFHIKEMHRKVTTGEKKINEFSNKLQEYHDYYLDFLDINNNY